MDLTFSIRHGVSNKLRFAAMALQNRDRECRVAWINHITEPNAHVKNFKHFAVIDIRVPLNEREDRMGLDKVVNFETHLGLDSR
jgi:hypothetical protein